MFNKIRYLLIGSPLPSHELAHERLNKLRALATFSPDALSSVAYATGEIFLALVAAGSAGLAFLSPVAMAIAALLGLVALSYYQTLYGYPSGGGSYVVARENLGTVPSLVAGAALLVDYVLAAAVSLTAGVAAITSAFPVLLPYRTVLALLLLGLVMLANLRGIRESGTAMSVPVYFFVGTYALMIAIGAVRIVTQGPVPLDLVAPPATQPFTAFLVVRAFAVGCTALTGIEAISNGVPSFQPPEWKNAGRTLIIMALLMAFIFVGAMVLIQYLAVIPLPNETLTSALARQLLGSGPTYLVVQIATLAILAVAANTSFAGFPRVTSIMARDGFLPRQLASLGDRLVFTNSILLLAAATAVLIVVFNGDAHALIPLYALGAFVAFTLSQAGMVLHWLRVRDGRRWFKALLNGLGALLTGITALVVGITKFAEGAWITILVIPVVVWVLMRIRAHYTAIRQELSLSGLPPSLRPAPPPRVVIPISGVHRGMFDAVAFARSIATDVTGVYVELEAGAGARVREQWQRYWPDLPLVILPSPYRSVVGPLLDYLDRTDRERCDGRLAAVVLPEFVPARWWQSILHSQTAWVLKTALLYRRRILGMQRTIIDVPFHLRRS